MFEGAEPLAVATRLPYVSGHLSRIPAILGGVHCESLVVAVLLRCTLLSRLIVFSFSFFWTLLSCFVYRCPSMVLTLSFVLAALLDLFFAWYNCSI